MSAIDVHPVRAPIYKASTRREWSDGETPFVGSYHAAQAHYRAKHPTESIIMHWTTKKRS